MNSRKPTAEERWNQIAPCVGCSFCCSQALCAIGNAKHGVRPPCPELRHHDGRYWCGIIEDAPEHSRAQYMEVMAIGAGCSSSMFNTMRDAQIASMKKGK